MRVPKRIWQTWKTSEVPEKWRSSPESIRRLCPDWEYVLTTDEQNREFVQKEFPQFLDLYMSFDREIYRVDMVRYLLLYKYGGVYMDLDLELLRPLEDLLDIDSELYLVRTPNLGGYTNALMASAPGVTFWLDCIAEIAHRVQYKPWYIQGDLQVLWTTGPSMITSVAARYTHPYVTIPYRLGHPCSVCDNYRGTGDLSQAYVKELEGSSWSGSAAIVHYFMCCTGTVLAILGVILLLIFLFWWIGKS